MADLTKITTLTNGDVFDPQVASDMINAKVSARAAMTGYIKVDTTLEGVAGSTVTVPVWAYIGDADDIPEGQPIDTTKMGYTTKDFKVKKVGKGVMVTDEAQLCGHGNPIGVATSQLALSISSKLDNDRVDVLYDASTIYDASTSVIGYAPIVDAVDLFDEEGESRKVILINPKQKTQLRKDPDFMDKNKFGGEVMSLGAIGRVAGCDVVPSKKVKMVDGVYYNPIIMLDSDTDSEDELPAVTYYLKKGANTEHERVVGVGDNIVSTAHGTAALTNESKVVILKTKATKATS